jgi:hypothetical protein
MDPGRYAYESLFNRLRREEEQANLDRAFKEEQRRTAQTDRQQNMSGIGILAEQRQSADANARLRTFRRGLAGI